MLDDIFDRLFDLRLVRKFKINTTPRWIILLIDMLIVAASYGLVVMADIYAHKSIISPVSLVGNFSNSCLFPDLIFNEELYVRHSPFGD